MTSKEFDVADEEEGTSSSTTVVDDDNGEGSSTLSNSHGSCCMDNVGSGEERLPTKRPFILIDDDKGEGSSMLSNSHGSCCMDIVGSREKRLPMKRSFILIDDGGVNNISKLRNKFDGIKISDGCHDGNSSRDETLKKPFILINNGEERGMNNISELRNKFNGIKIRDDFGYANSSGNEILKREKLGKRPMEYTDNNNNNSPEKVEGRVEKSKASDYKWEERLRQERLLTIPIPNKKESRNNFTFRKQMEPRFPQLLRDMIRVKAGGKRVSEPILVLQGRLSVADTDVGQTRLLIPLAICNRFLHQFELALLPMADVPIIEPDSLISRVSLGRWGNKAFVLKDRWNEIVRRNGLYPGMFIQLWAVRSNGRLIFCLVVVPHRMMNKHD